MKLYNLIYEDKYFVSCIAPSKLPDKNFCYVEIIFDEKAGNITSVTGVLQNDAGEDEKEDEENDEEKNTNGRKESVLSDLDVSPYIAKLKVFLKREDVDKDKIHLNFVENVENEDDRILKIFIILVSSYLIYFNFMQFPYVISLDLLNNERFQYFTAFSSTNVIEENFINQVSLLHRFFSDIFTDIKDKGKRNEKEEKDEEAANLIEEIKEYKRRMFSDLDKKLASFSEKFEEIEEMKTKLSAIFRNF